MNTYNEENSKLVNEILILGEEHNRIKKIVNSNLAYITFYNMKYYNLAQIKEIKQKIDLASKIFQETMLELSNISDILSEKANQLLNLYKEKMIICVDIIEDVNNTINKYMMEIKQRFNVEKDEDIDYLENVRRFNKDDYKLNSRFNKILFNSNEKGINEIRYKYFIILDGTNIANCMFTNKQNEILGTLLSGRMKNFDLENHSTTFYDENIEIPPKNKVKIQYAYDIQEIKMSALELCAGVLNVMKTEEKFYQQSVLNNRILGLFEFSGENATKFFQHIAMNDYGIDFGDDIEVHFARQIIFPAEENNVLNQISTSRKEFFTISIPKVDVLLGNGELIEISCDDIPELKKMVDAYKPKDKIDEYGDDINICPEYVRRIFFNNTPYVAELSLLTPQEYMLIKTDKKLKESNKWVSIDISDFYLSILMDTEFLKEIELDYDWEQLIKKLAPQYYGEPEEDDDEIFETNIGGLNAHIKGFGNGVFGIGFDLPEKQ